MSIHVRVIGTSRVEAIRRAASAGEVKVVNLDQEETVNGPAGLIFSGLN